MRRQSLKMAVVGGAVALVVLFGIDMATSGIERVNGPIDQTGALSVNPTNLYEQPVTSYESPTSSTRTEDNLNVDRELPANQGTNATRAQRVVDAQHGRKTQDPPKLQTDQNLQTDSYGRLPGVPDLRTDSSVNQLADGTADVLQSISSKGIRFIVSFFESVTD
ncbi:hypothetical protein Back11_26690 [Paenibacillus baekrokdamisoli]|uniref:Uncharacterized protein n=1 Tax=Paenibacillus baekrokdamisoli TaxID=1712516 RepID=A0A3G9JDS5_9BACL|nr:hypothetical protein [Paenibacillus baekrokdamisoli]MBB3070319.1 hypothetical protein [Paenibacillus baekrokdamisoli]BBH21324.1 hypothetical protein Back11_26690 [Paenibacillus baekrokdamisoli]